jgi:putative N6-adenine-specific DNA methylase
MIVMNPPYGERMNPLEINSLYRGIGDTLKKSFAGYEAWIISSNKEALKNLGLQTSQKLTLYNGPLEVKFHKYELYKGSKKKR